MLFKRDNKINEVAKQSETYFGFLKNNMSKLFDWIKYLSHRDELQEQRITQLEQLRRDELQRINYVVTKMHDLQKPVLNEEDRRKIDQTHTNYEFLVSKINHLEEQLTNPDVYIVDKERLEIQEVTVNQKTLMFTRDNNNKIISKDLPESQQNNQVIDYKQVREAARLAKKVDAIFNYPQQVEYCFLKGKCFILGCKDLKI